MAFCNLLFHYQSRRRTYTASIAPMLGADKEKTGHPGLFFIDY
jgi:hypothetical protein